MPELSPYSWAWLLAFGLFALISLLAIAAQTAHQLASRPRLRLLVEARVKGARGALAMLSESSPTPTLLLLLLIAGIGGAAGSLVQGSATAPIDQLAVLIGFGSVTCRRPARPWPPGEQTTRTSVHGLAPAPHGVPRFVAS